MIELPSIKDSMDSLFYYLARFYDEKRFPDFKGVYQFILKDDNEYYDYYIEIGGAKAESRKGRHSASDVEVMASVNDFFNILNGSLNPLLGYILGKYKVKGRWPHLFALRNLFGKQFDGKILKEMEPTDNFAKLRRGQWRKPGNVLVINGSPHLKDGFTYFYLKHLLKGIKEAGSSVELIDIYDKDIKVNSCRGCFTCMRRVDGRCVIADDADQIVEKINQAQLVIYAFPLHVRTVPDKLQTLLNRTFRLFEPYTFVARNLSVHPRRNKKLQHMAVFSISMWPEKEQFRPCMDTFRLNSILLDMPLLACILRPGAEPLYNAITQREFLKKIFTALEKAGRILVENGDIPNGLLDFISRPYNSRKRFVNLMNQFVYLNYKKLG